MPKHAALISTLNLENLHAGMLQIRGVVVQNETLAMRMTLNDGVNIQQTWFEGAANFDQCKSERFGAPEIVAKNGLSLFGLRLDGNLDLAYAVIYGQLNALDLQAGDVQLYATALVSPKPANEIALTPWELGLHAGETIALNGAYVEGRVLNLYHPEFVSLDLREFRGSVSVQGPSLRRLVLDPRVPIEKASDLRGISFDKLVTGSICGEIKNTCQTVPTRELDSTRDLSLWLQACPRGTPDFLRVAARVATSKPISQELYLMSKWSESNSDLLFVVTGDG